MLLFEIASNLTNDCVKCNNNKIFEIILNFGEYFIKMSTFIIQIN